MWDPGFQGADTQCIASGRKGLCLLEPLPRLLILGRLATELNDFDGPVGGSISNDASHQFAS
jgi:hypothetical protein